MTTTSDSLRDTDSLLSAARPDRITVAGGPGEARPTVASGRIVFEADPALVALRVDALDDVVQIDLAHARLAMRGRIANLHVADLRPIGVEDIAQRSPFLHAQVKGVEHELESLVVHHAQHLRAVLHGAQHERYVGARGCHRLDDDLQVRPRSLRADVIEVAGDSLDAALALDAVRQPAVPDLQRPEIAMGRVFEAQVGGAAELLFASRLAGQPVIALGPIDRYDAVDEAQSVVAQQRAQLLLRQLMWEVPLHGVEAEFGRGGEARADVELGEQMVEVGAEARHSHSPTNLCTCAAEPRRVALFDRAGATHPHRSNWNALMSMVTVDGNAMT